jgi:hypothetical protein
MRIRQITPTFGSPVLLAVALTLWPGVALQARAQEADEPPPANERNAWFNLGVAGSPDGLGLAGSISYRAAERLLISARGMGVESLQICIFDPCSATRTYELAFLPGLVVVQNRKLLASLSAGVGLIRRKASSSQVVTEVGLPLELQLYLLPSRSVGFGVTGLANFNRGGTFWAGVLGLQIGL